MKKNSCRGVKTRKTVKVQTHTTLWTFCVNYHVAHSTADLCCIAFDVMSNTIESNVGWTTALKRFRVVDWQWHLCIFGLASGKVHFADLPDELQMCQWQSGCSHWLTVQEPSIVHGSLQQVGYYRQYHFRHLIRIRYCAMFWSKRSTPPINLLYWETRKGWSTWIFALQALDQRLAA